MRATFGMGPVGSGTHVVGYELGRPGPQDVEVWLLLLFFPLVPLACLSVSSTGAEREAGEIRSVELVLHSRSRVALRGALRRVAWALVAVLLIALPMAFGVWMIGAPWATELLSALLGQVPELLAGCGKLGAKLGKVVAVGIPLAGAALELGVFLAGAAIPILALMRLDGQTPRVTIRAALGASARMPSLSEDAAQQRHELTGPERTGALQLMPGVGLRWGEWCEGGRE